MFQYNEDALRYKTLDEFKQSVKNGGELSFEWNGMEWIMAFSFGRTLTSFAYYNHMAITNGSIKPWKSC